MKYNSIRLFIITLLYSASSPSHLLSMKPDNLYPYEFEKIVDQGWEKGVVYYRICPNALVVSMTPTATQVVDLNTKEIKNFEANPSYGKTRPQGGKKKEGASVHLSPSSSESLSIDGKILAVPLENDSEAGARYIAWWNTSNPSAPSFLKTSNKKDLYTSVVATPHILFTGSTHGKVRAFDVISKTLFDLYTCEDKNSCIWNIVVNNPLTSLALIVGLKENKVLLFDLKITKDGPSLSLKKTIPHSEIDSSSLSYSPDGSCLGILGTRDPSHVVDSVKVINIATLAAIDVSLDRKKINLTDGAWGFNVLNSQGDFIFNTVALVVKGYGDPIKPQEILTPPLENFTECAFILPEEDSRLLVGSFNRTESGLIPIISSYKKTPPPPSRCVLL